MRSSTSSLINVLEYYLLVVLSSVLLFRQWPALREAITAARLRGLSTPGGVPREFGLGGAQFTDPFADPFGGAFPASIAMLGALALVVPVAWVYTIIKRGERYDPSVLQSVIIMPIAVAGIVIIVQHNIALAFSLAGIVAAVRFRTTLKDTKDAVYIFLAIGVGLAAGVQALMVALIMSVVFNAVVLAVWRFDIGGIYTYSGSGTAGDGGRRRETAGDREGGSPPKKPFNGLLRIRTSDIEAARMLAEQVLDREVKRWEPAGSFGAPAGTLQYLVRLKKKTPAAALLAMVRDAGTAQDVTVEFEPFER